MYQKLRVGAVIPAYNEAQAISHVIKSLFDLSIKGQTVFDYVVVCDNRSSDATALMAEKAGAMVTTEFQRGYGAACLAAIKALPCVDVIVFVDGDVAEVKFDKSSKKQIFIKYLTLIN